ncbi:hypothetical protein [Gemmatimonas aurantiaca]|uniref:hypothetical protein n=1 Tax=Gemmatimonas aurantiaca TaxID=173480 RepID=UPI00301BCA0C
MKEAQYQKTANGSNVTFTVTPAGRPSLGCSGGLFYILLGFLAGMLVGAVVNETVGMLVGVGVFAWCLLKVDFRPKLHRTPSSFVVSPDGITVKGMLYPAADIHHLAIRNHYDRSQEIVLTGQTISTGTGMGVDIKHALQQVTYLLQLEVGGKAHVLAAGLDETTARGLHTDVLRAMGAQGSVA